MTGETNVSTKVETVTDLINKNVDEAVANQNKQEDVIEKPVEQQEKKEELEKNTDTEDTKEKWPKSAENAYNNQKKKAAKYRAEVEELRKQFEEFRTKSSSPQNVEQKSETKTSSGDMPKEEDFETYGQYLDALTDYKVNKLIAERENKINEEQTKHKNAEYLNEREAYLDDNAVKASKDFSDFAEVLEKNKQELGSIAPHVKQALLEADNGAYALYNLAKEGLLDRLNDMSPYKVASLVARAEDKALADLKAKKVTKASAPIGTNTGTGSSGGYLDDLSADELIKWIKS